MIKTETVYFEIPTDKPCKEHCFEAEVIIRANPNPYYGESSFEPLDNIDVDIISCVLLGPNGRWKLVNEKQFEEDIIEKAIRVYYS